MTLQLRKAVEQRRGQVEADRAIQGGHMVAEGIIDLLGTGEVTVEVPFPVTFVEMPIVLGGGIVGVNQRIVPGEFPTVDVQVLRFDEIINPATPDSPRYRGCTLIIVVEGAADDEDTYKSHAWWTARGRALTNPVTGAV